MALGDMPEQGVHHLFGARQLPSRGLSVCATL
jgi:hypothetical protein